VKPAGWFDQQYFDGAGKSNYSAYTETTANFAAYADAVQALLARHHLPARGPVLDVGCAKAYLVAELRRRGVEAYGVDVSEYALACAPTSVRPFLRHASALDLGLINLMEYPPLTDPAALDRFSRGKYALAVSFDVFEHFTEDAARRAFRELRRVSDYQLVQVNTGWHPAVAFDGDESHVLKLPLAEWRRLAAEEGCTHTTIVETGRGEVGA